MEGQQLMEAEDEVLGTDVNEFTEGAEPVEPNAELEANPESEPVEEQMYEIDGEKYTASQVKEWKAGNMKDADYRKKTTELADQRREYEKNQENIKAYQETIDYINNNPELLEQVNDMLTNHYEGTASTGDAPSVKSEGIPSWAREIKQQQEDYQLEKALDKVKSNPQFADMFGDEDKVSELLRIAHDKKVTDLELIANSMQNQSSAAKIAEAKLAGAEEVTKGLTNKAKVKPPIGTGSGMQTPPKATSKDMSMEQVFENVSDDLFQK